MLKKLLLSFVLVFGIVATAVLAMTAEDVKTQTTDYYMANNPTLSLWDLGALYGAGADLTDDDYSLDLTVTKEPDKRAVPTDYANFILSRLILKKDPATSDSGTDYCAKLAGLQSSSGSFSSAVNQHIWAMITLNAAQTQYDREAALDYLGDAKCADGGFNLDPGQETSYADVTGMALIALSDFDDEYAQTLISGAVQFLNDAWLSSDVFNNANTISAAISGLCAAGEDIFDEKWLKEGRSLLDELCEYMLSDGSFKYLPEDTKTNGLATSQALIAVCDIINGKSVWTGFEVPVTVTANLRIEGISETILHRDVTITGVNPTVLDVVEQELQAGDIPYEVRSTDFGAYLYSIREEWAGDFNGEGGWLYAVKQKTDPHFPESLLAISDCPVTKNDEIVVYYGSWAPNTLLARYSIEPSEPRANEDIKITLTATYQDWAAGQPEDTTVKIENAVVKFGSKTYLTDEEGVALIDDITEEGTYKVSISKTNEKGYPAIVRIPEFNVTVKKAKNTDSNNNTGSNRTGTGGSIVTTPPPVKQEEESQQPQQSVKEDISYSDSGRISDWAKDYISSAAKYGIMQGNDNNEFMPDKNITRAEFIAVLIRLLNKELTAQTVNFNDVEEKSWYYSYVSTGVLLGYINGYDDNTFRPEENITREEAAVIISRAVSLSNDGMEFEDKDKISPWAKDAVSKIGASKIMQGSDGYFEPDQRVTREMTAVVAVRLYERILNKELSLIE